MTKRTVIFHWDFAITTDFTGLTVYLNDGVNKKIDLTHERAFEHVANVLAEILIHDHRNLVKTVLHHTEVIDEALEIISEQDRSVQIDK